MDWTWASILDLITIGAAHGEVSTQPDLPANTVKQLIIGCEGLSKGFSLIISHQSNYYPDSLQSGPQNGQEIESIRLRISPKSIISSHQS